ncbi:MAG: phosphoribosylaminoimidazolesuccinocarboxamide synthase [Phycisphaerae bacterium]|jgi:phosphoribosylaminoimidazole-succinocarboxamide synthase|nr:phosphoribosylaminoimidazolesuccinocarboxamide synthase [Phycisphaerae bacterium]MDP7637826.1 phosphoribosylaminoimidazolesuccinocarboxamide synthase [Phycisphaerae bacterium]
MKSTALLTTSLGDRPKRSGKVRDIYELADALLMVATDRISAYDVVMPNGIPDKGRVLTQISVFWFEMLADLAPNHLVSASPDDLPEEFRNEEQLEGRFMLCRKTQVVPIECVVRGYLAGSGWREYKKSGTVCGVTLPAGLKQATKLSEPIFTPATKAQEGHDENISFPQACELVGQDVMTELRDKSIAVYNRACDYATDRGILLADTKFEWGRDAEGNLILIDEVLTPDSSRFWPADGYKPGKDQPSFDKQFVRDYLDKIKFDRTPPAPPLPTEIVQKTREKYIDAYTMLTGRKFPWE